MVDFHKEKIPLIAASAIACKKKTKRKTNQGIIGSHICLLCNENCMDKKLLHAHMRKEHRKSQKGPVKCKCLIMH